MANRCIRVRATNEVIIDNVSRVVEPPCRKFVQHLALERNNCDNTIESRQSIGGEKESCVVMQRIRHSDFSRPSVWERKFKI